ncbi:MAG TPA: 23S rRNA (adenine(2503)-C(2))-methyltransferase RlmN, partial [Chthoniobacterales bacterium]
MQPLGSITLAEFSGFLAAKSQPAYRAKQVFEWVYRKREFGIDRMSNLPADLRSTLAAEFDLSLPEVVRVQGSEDTTRKFLFRFPDGDLVESVLIPASPALYGEKSDRRTICLSSQVGCAYGCKFCASGLDGWKRNL